MAYSKGHTVYVNHLGKEVPSATTVLKIINKPHLATWANAMGFRRKNIKQILEDSSKLGTAVHNIIEKYMMKQKYKWETDDEVLKYRVLSHLGNFIEWKKNHEVEPQFMERQLVSIGFGGTVDFFGTVDGKYTILDFKTSKQVYSTMFLQLGAYAIMLEELGHTVEQAAIIIIREDRFDEKFISREELQPYMDCFLLLLNLFHAWYDLNQADGWGDILG